MHRLLLHNDEIRDTRALTLGAGQVGLLSGWGVFSTLRVYDGVMFEWERHWQRMKRDAERIRVPLSAEPNEIETALYRLIEANQATNATLRVAIVRNRGGLFEGPGQTRDFDVIAFTTDLVRWPQTVKLGLAPHARHAANEFAGIKYLSWAENLTRYERAHEQGLDEVILLNENGEVAECTSANIFVVQENQVWTPPLASGCLAGITRAVLLEEIQAPDFKMGGKNIEIGEKALTLDSLQSADEIFITSTTRELLPVSSIEGLAFRKEPQQWLVCDALRKSFTQLIKSYMARQKSVYN